MSSLRYRKEIDGLRAIAVLAVVFYHAGLGCPGGFIGVDVFFVISGFLITSLIVKDILAGTFNFVDFWDRRVRRIFPAMAVCVAVTLIAGVNLLLPNDLVALGKSSIAQLGVVSNIFFWRNTNYFGGDTFDKPLLHTWSLSVEEQFYLFFPLLLTFIIGLRASRIHKKVTFALVCMILVSFFLAVWWVKHQPFAAFYLLPTRAWELLCGGLLAVIPEPRCMKRFYREVLSVVGLAAILIPIYLYNDSTPFPGLAAVPPCVGTALLIWANGGRSNQGDSRQLSIIGKGISLPPIRFVGLLSYSLYLWHWPVLVYASYWKIEPFTKWESLGLVAGAILISFLSWKYVETPFRKKFTARLGRGFGDSRC